MSTSIEVLNKDNGDNPNPEASVGGQGRDNASCCACVSEQVYVDSGNEKKVLFLMCIGLMYCNNNNEEQPLFSMTEEPWSLLPKNSHVRPKNSEYILEVTRRADLFNVVPVPRPSNWTRIQILEWLNHNPIRDVVDIEFLTNEVLRLQDLLVVAQQQQGIDSETTASGGQGGQRNWRGIVPYLRVIMSLTQDDVKCLFLPGLTQDRVRN
jgi:hypothetical protein